MSSWTAGRANLALPPSASRPAVLASFATRRRYLAHELTEGIEASKAEHVADFLLRHRAPDAGRTGRTSWPLRSLFTCAAILACLEYGHSPVAGNS